MTVQYSVAVRNAQLDAFETTIGTSAILKIRSGATPDACATADSGTVLATLNLPSDWMDAASGGSKTFLGVWQDVSADVTGTAGHFRIYASDGVTCHMQGSITLAGGGGDMILGDTTVVSGTPVIITGFVITAGNA
jgi:hypothetical protein